MYSIKLEKVTLHSKTGERGPRKGSVHNPPLPTIHTCVSVHNKDEMESDK